MLFQFQFRTKEKADAFVAGLKRLPGAVQPQDWSHTGPIIRQSGAEKGRLWERYFVQLIAPEQATQPLQQMAQKNSALKWNIVEAAKIPGEEPGHFGNFRGQLYRGGQGERAMPTSRAIRNANFERKDLAGDEDFTGYGKAIMGKKPKDR